MRVVRLLERSGHVAEGVVQGVAKWAKARKDANADDRSDQAVFDCRGAGLVLEEAREDRGHVETPKCRLQILFQFDAWQAAIAFELEMTLRLIC
jgi:hypothetical protein